MNPQEKQKLKTAIMAKGWQMLDENAMDEGYSQLTVDEKRMIIKSLLEGTPEAGRFIKERLSVFVEQYADNQITQIESTGLIPVNLIIHRL